MGIQISAATFAIAAALSLTVANSTIKAPVAVVTARGSANAVFLTRDGRRWRNVTPPRLLLSVDDVSFVDAKHGWIVTTDCARGKARLYRTLDGARTWGSKRVSILSHSCNAGARVMLDFLTGREGFATVAEPTGPGESLHETRDGGSTWQPVGQDLPSVGEIQFRTSTEGWLGGLHLYRSHDAGRTWQRVRLPTPLGPGNSEAPPQFAVPAFHGSHALTAGSFPRGKQLLVWVYATPDSGRHWRLIARFARRWRFYWPAVAMSQPSPRVAWIAAPTTTPMLCVTENGGTSWSRRRLPFRVGRLQALDAKTAIATTLSGRIRVTHDGGAIWRRPSLSRRTT
jgi:photosystem II stability/assembly factor-like uncharacterized protein